MNKKSYKLFLASAVVALPAVTLVACGGTKEIKNEFYLKHLQSGFNDLSKVPSFMTEVNTTDKTFTLDLSGEAFQNITEVDGYFNLNNYVTNLNSPFPYQVTKEGGGTELIYLNVKKIVFHKNLVKIGKKAFAGRNGFFTVEELVFPADAKLETIESGAFYSQSLKTLKLPASVTFIGELAFAKNNLTSIEFTPSATATIENFAFSENMLSPNALVPGGNLKFNSEFVFKDQQTNTPAIEAPTTETPDTSRNNAQEA
ncbi:leucine-rich repeat protein [Candidatus Mycoplasma pogonae]